MPTPSTTPARPTPEPTRRKVPVRRKVGETTLTATQLPSGRPVELANGLVISGQIDDWMVCRGPLVVDVLSPAAFAQAYDLVEADRLRLSPRTCTILDGCLGPGSTESEDALARAVTRLALAKIGDVNVTFTPGQWETLQHRALKMGLTLHALMQRIVARVTEDIFAGRA